MTDVFIITTVLPLGPITVTAKADVSGVTAGIFLSGFFSYRFWLSDFFIT